MYRLKLMITIALATFMLTGCPQPDPNRDVSFVLPPAQVAGMTTKGKNIGILCLEKPSNITWSVTKKPAGAHADFSEAREPVNSSEVVYSKYFKADKAGTYTIRIKVEARGKSTTKNADMNVTEAK